MHSPSEKNLIPQGRPPSADFPRLHLSALVLTRNEEKKIGACLASLTWADEILVIDAESTDATAQICQDPQAPWADRMRWISRKWNGFREQRNESLDQARHDWVFVVDADEVCSPELRDHILHLLSLREKIPFQAYKVHRQEFFQGKPIFYGMWNPSYQDRFFNKMGVRYINEVHEYPVFAGPPGMIHESLLHHSHLTVERYMEKLNHYTTIEAQDRFQKGQRTHAFKLIAAFPAHAFKSYFYYQAYKDGIHGVVISLLEGVSRVVRQIKIWQLQVQNSKSSS